MPTDWEDRFSPYGRRAGGAETRTFLKLVGQPGLISFAGGVPDGALFPAALIAEAHRRILDDPVRAKVALQYTTSEGDPALRQWIARYMATRGVVCGADNILITNGSQQGLYLTGRLLLAPGDKVLTSRPTYLGLLHALAGNEPCYGPLSELIAAGQCAAKLAYAMADFANPAGVSLSLKERQAIVAGAQTNDVLILEDAAYAELRYDGAPLPSLLALDLKHCCDIEKSRVIYCGTFSKTIVPGLRVGWVIAASPVIQKMGLLKQCIDFHAGTLSQMVLTEVAERLPQSHVAMLCETYRARRDAMLAALEVHMPEDVTWTKPEGGMFTWMTLPEKIDARELLKEAIRAGVAFVPGTSFFPDKAQHNNLRLNFTMCDPAAIAEGIARLGRLIHERSDAWLRTHS